jgi:hypothetical protein
VHHGFGLHITIQRLKLRAKPKKKLTLFFGDRIPRGMRLREKTPDIESNSGSSRAPLPAASIREPETSRLLNRSRSPTCSSRSSLEVSAIRATDCKVSIFDEPRRTATSQLEDDLMELNYVRNFDIPHESRSASIPEELTACLDHRDRQKTRWIMVTGWSPDLMTELSRRMLDGHKCLDLQSLEQNTFGGPIKCDDNSYFVWVQTVVWSIAQTDRELSVTRCSLRMVVCLPTPTTAGTVITHLSGANLEAIDTVSKALAGFLDLHSMGTDALQCVWVLAFSILRAVAEQLDLAFHVFDPLSEAEAFIPHIDQVPRMLQQANDLARIERYTSEIVTFFDVVRSFQQSQTSEPRFEQPPRGEGSLMQSCYAVISPRSNLESELVKQRIGHSRELCQTCIKQCDNLLQMVCTAVERRIDMTPANSFLFFRCSSTQEPALRSDSTEEAKWPSAWLEFGLFWRLGPVSHRHWHSLPVSSA